MAGECGATNGVSFVAHCAAMDVMGLGKICDEIYGGSEGAWRGETAVKDNPSFCQETAGDGMTRLPRYGDVAGTWQIKNWHDFKYWNAANDPVFKLMERAVALGGAFGILEIPSFPTDYSSIYLGVFREDLPIELIGKIQNLYKECSKRGPGVCSSGKTAREVKVMWRNATEYLHDVPGQTPDEKKLRVYTGRFNQLRQNYAFLERQAPDRAKLEDAVQVYTQATPPQPRTSDEYKSAIRNYRLKVRAAIMHVYGNNVPPDENGKAGIPAAPSRNETSEAGPSRPETPEKPHEEPPPKNICIPDDDSAEKQDYVEEPKDSY